MRVCVVAEYYPNRHDPSHGVWAHRQAVAAREAGAEVRVLAMRRPIPPLSTLSRPGRLWGWARDEVAQPPTETREGIRIRRVPFVSPPRPVSYQAWGGWAARPVGRALAAIEREWPFDLVHAHYAVPAGRAAVGFARSRGRPLVVSVHGADVLDTAVRSAGGRRTVTRVLDQAALVLCNSAYTLRHTADLGLAAERMRVVRLGAAEPATRPERRPWPAIASSGYLVARKRHEDVLRAVASLRADFPDLSYLIVGDGPERARIEALARQLGVADRVEIAGQLAPEDALSAVASCHVMALPSVDEAFGVVYAEAMAAGLVAVGCVGEGGPEEISALGDGMVKVAPRRPEALAVALRDLLAHPEETAALGERARATAREHLSWSACGEATVAAYREACG